MEVLKKLLAIRAKLADLKTQTDQAQAEEKKLKDQALEYFAENSLDKVSIDGQTIYTTTKVWARLPEPDTAIPVLQQHGLGFLVKPTVNTNSLSSWYREQLDTGQELPQALLDVIKVSDSPDIAVRKVS